MVIKTAFHMTNICLSGVLFAILQDYTVQLMLAEYHIVIWIVHTNIIVLTKYITHSCGFFYWEVDQD